jgi:hypothetical protein
MEHAKRVLDRFIVRADDRDPFMADAITIAVFAKKHAVPEALFHPRNLGWQMENAGRDQQAFCAIGFSSTF